MIKFGTGGWRGLIGEEFTRENVELAARAMVQLLTDEKKTEWPVIIGYDRRFLSKEAMYWIGQILASHGIRTLLVKRASPTPLIMYYVQKHELYYGMMVTASHNPARYNGIKVFIEEGRDAGEAVTEKIERAALLVEEEERFTEKLSLEELRASGLLEEINPINEYLDDILEKIDVQAIRNRELRVAVDPMFGVSMRSLNIILATMRCETEILHARHDTLFGGKMPAPAWETIQALRNHVMDYDYDIGIATDGDADRLGIIDDKGQYLSANDIISLIYYYFLEYKGCRGPVVENIATTQLLDNIAAAYGQKCFEVPVGFKHISAKMEETGALIGGESSGGLTIASHIKGKDGIFAAALLIEIMAKTEKPLSALKQEMDDRFGSFYTDERSFRFTPEGKRKLEEEIFDRMHLPVFPCNERKLSWEDGCKVYFDTGWLLIRFSGTEPLLRLFCEMQDKVQAQRINDLVEEFYSLRKMEAYR